jgi:hypothetical protein
MLPARPLLGVALLTLALSVAAAPAATASGVEPRDAGVRRIEALVAEARFREAAEQAPTLRRAVLAMRPSADTRRMLVRTELAAGTAALALGQEGAARICFLRALQLEPTLVLGSATPPKVRSTLDSLREVRE